MVISLSWLKKYVDIDVPVQILCDKMVMAGFEVESIVDLSETMTNVVTGKILSIDKHPDADKLVVCSIDVNKGEPIQIVTGANNVFVGAVVPVALHDSHLPNGVHIKKGKLRGVVSEGMLCSGGELCLKEWDYAGAEVDGILILKEGTPVGADMREILSLFDYCIDFKITANRPDCQSVIGVAREVAVVLGKQFKLPATEYKTVAAEPKDDISVEVHDFELCNRYYGRVVKNLRIKESPEWLKLCLRAAGMRPINNIVDITNYVMLETGQPMHAFDKREIEGDFINVRRAVDGEKIVTLDEKEHSLNSDMLVIADAVKPSCLAGIMGSAGSGIKDDTTDLFLESAKFKRDNVRKTARALGMRTESSARFERGVDIINVEYAMNRALGLIYELDAGDIVEGVVDINHGLPTDRELNVSVDSVNALLGLNIPAQTMLEILNSLSIKTELKDGVLNCLVPSFRDDVEGRADIAEEVMRIYGYDHIIGTPMVGQISRGKKLTSRLNDDKVKATLCAASMREIATYSFTSSHAIDALNLADDDKRKQCVTIINPLGDEYSTMRTQLITSMLTVAATNINRKNAEGRLFEISRLFIAESLPLTKQPEERPALCIGMFGKDEDFFTLKGVVDDVVSIFTNDAEYVISNETYLHPTCQAEVFVEKDGAKISLGYLGEVHPDTAKTFGINERVYICQIDLVALYALDKAKIIYKPLPKFPAVERDIALVCERSTPVATLEKVIKTSGGKLVEDVKLFDVYESEHLGADKKSVAFAMKLRANDRTLTDEECNVVMNKILKQFESMGVSLRS